MPEDLHPGQAVVLYDGECALCRKSMQITRKLDWFGRIAFQDCHDVEHHPPSAVPLELPNMLREMHVVTPDRQRVYIGFRALRWMAWRMPLTLPLAPFAYLPGVPWLGHKFYLWVAKNRLNLVPCHDGACRVPLKGK